MAEWFVRYLDVQTNRETESRRMDTRDEAIALCSARARPAVRQVQVPASHATMNSSKPAATSSSSLACSRSRILSIPA